MKKAKKQNAGSAKKNPPKKEEVSGRLSKSGADGGLQPLGAQKRAHRTTTVPREGDTTTTVPRE